ncbi:hypothetical protein QM312_35880, partial [Burkholderia cenocepacia]|nr:hypothetical protein [Burkholderia cenocepacia]
GHRVDPDSGERIRQASVQGRDGERQARAEAEQEQRVVSLDALFLLGFGPRLPLAVTTLHRRLSDALA